MLRPFLRRLLAAVAVGFAAAAAYSADVPLLVDKAHSEFEFDVRATMHSFTGQVSDYEAEILADAEVKKVNHVRVRFPFASATTGDKKRDRDMLEWEEAGSFPEVVFVLSQLEPAGDGRFQATGQLTFHGVTKVVRFPVGIAVADGRTYSFDGATELDVRDYGLPVIRKFAMLKVQPVVKVRFHLQASANGK